MTLLREQNKLIKEYQGSLLDTVYWALGGVFGLLLFVSGINWWSNFKVYEKDRQKLRDEVMAILNDFEINGTSQLKANHLLIEQSVDRKLDTFAIRMATELSEVRGTITSELSEVRGAVASDISEARGAVASVRTEMEKQLITLQRSNTELSSRATLLRTNLAKANAELRLVEELVWDIRGTHSNILITQGQGLSAAIESGDDQLIEIVLNRMKNTIQEKFINPGKKLNPKIPELIERRIIEAEGMKPILVAEVRDLLSQIPSSAEVEKSSDA